MSVPVEPGREQARAWAVDELSRREYQDARPSLLERVVHWLLDHLSRIHLGGGAPTLVGLTLLTLLLAAVIGYSIHRSGGVHRSARRSASAVFPGRNVSAADHRARADRHASAGEWDQAVVERFRAIARTLEERALLAPQPGRTAVEVARDGGAAVPELAGSLLTAARAFDDVSYGHLKVGQAADQTMRILDTRLQSATPLALTP
jgi:hypothetical protein